MSRVNDWWSSLTTKEKERIGSKITGETCRYPKCTEVWMGLSEYKKGKIYEHCTNDHGLIETDWSEGKTFSY